MKKLAGGSRQRAVDKEAVAASSKHGAASRVRDHRELAKSGDEDL